MCFMYWGLWPWLKMFSTIIYSSRGSHFSLDFLLWWYTAEKAVSRKSGEKIAKCKVIRMIMADEIAKKIKTLLVGR